jgi:hypothetical protein
MKLILFSHHSIDPYVIERFEAVKKLNPTWDVIPIGFKEHVLLPNSLIVDASLYPTDFDIQYHVPKYHVHWFECDLFLYDGYRQRPDYDAYFLYEYDTISNIGIDLFFDTSLDFFGNNIENPANEDWEWVKLYRKHNIYHRHFEKIYSYGQSTCIYMVNDIIKKCTEEVINNKHLYNNMLSEIRGGTLVHQFTDLKKGKRDVQNFISWTPSDINVNLNASYFYHPVK